MIGYLYGGKNRECSIVFVAWTVSTILSVLPHDHALIFVCLDPYGHRGPCLVQMFCENV